MLKLLFSRSFGPFFWSQFTVALNDNLLKTGIILLLTFGAERFGRELLVFGQGAEAINPLAAGLLIIPFILLSAAAGQLADKYAKNRIIRGVKLAEVVIMGIAGVLFCWAATGQAEPALAALVALLFFAGAQSALYSPAKFAIVPELTGPDGLVAGNALLQFGSYVSILLGIVLAGVLIGLDAGPWLLAGTIFASSLFGYLCSRAIPATPAGSAEARVQWLSWRPTFHVVRRLRENPVLARSVVGISWFWAFGATLVTIFPVWTRDVLGGGSDVATLCMALFSVGIGVGSIVCSKLSPHGLELGLVAIGGIGLTLFPAVLAIAGAGPIIAGDVVGALDMLTTGRGLMISALLLAISASGGLFIVPLYSLLQARPDPSERGQVIAANNLVSSVYIVVSQVALIGLAAMGLTPPQIFGVLAFINLLGMIYLYSLIPEFMYRFLAWILSNILYRLKTEGIENIPATGGCVLVCNHVSFVDWLIVGGACPRPARFVMDKFMFQLPVANIFVRHAKAIPIASRKVDPEMLERAFDLIAGELEAGNVVCIFPEGGLTRDGNPLEYRAGIEKIIERTPVPVVPLALNGLWGSFFSRVDGAALKTPFRRGLRSPLWVKAGTPIPAEDATVETVRDAILEMWRQRPDDR